MNDGATLNNEKILENEILTVKEVAVYLRVNRVTVWRWCQQGTLPAVRVGRNWRIHRDDLMHLLDRPQPLDSTPIESDPTITSDSGIETLPVIIPQQDVNCGEDDGSDRDNSDI